MLTITINETERTLVNTALRHYSEHCLQVAGQVGALRAVELQAQFNEQSNACKEFIFKHTSKSAG
jgi:hypothetical protein